MLDAKQKYKNSIPLLFNRFCKYRDTFVFHDISCLQLLHNTSGITRAVLSAGLKLAKCFVLFRPLCQPGTCVAWKVSFPPSNESLMSMLLAVNCLKLSGFRSIRTTVPFISFKNRLYLAPVRGPTWGFACRSCMWPALCNRTTNSVERVAWRSLDEGYYLGRCVSASTWLQH